MVEQRGESGEALHEAAPGRRIGPWAALAVCAAFAALLGVRTITTPDLGYHLAYGETFLDTGRIVDDSTGLYATVSPDHLRYEPPPGTWRDERGRHRFPNANWLSQVVLAVVWRAGGPAGLSLLLAGVVAGLIFTAALTMRRLGLGPLAVAAGLLLTAMVAYERFLLRPELLGYLVLTVQMCVLVGVVRGRGRQGRSPGWATLAALVALQVLLVNLHSYFAVGLALTAAAAGEKALVWGWARLRGAEVPPHAAGAARGLGLCLLAQLVACFVNPWTWRLAALPVQTLAFMARHDIAGSGFREVGHPWSVIGEFFTPFAEGVFRDSKASYAYCALLGVAGVGAVAAAGLRRWAHLGVIAGMVGASLSMRRNIAPAALLVTPLALGGIADGVRRLARGWSPPRPASWRLVGAAVLMLAGGWGVVSVVTNGFYGSERRAVRFALGLTPTVVPVGAAAWLNRHDPDGRLWTDYNTSSNIHFFTRPHRRVPVLTNTWAYPPDVMELVLRLSRGRSDHRAALDALEVATVVLRVDRTSIPLARRLAADPAWALVHLDALHVVFLRAEGPGAALARRHAITPETLDVAGLRRRLAAADPRSSYATYLGAFTLAQIGWDSPAVAVTDEFIRRYPDDPLLHRVWTMRGTCLARRGTLRMLRKPPDLRGREDWHEARNSFLRALKLDSDYTPARANLREVEKQIADEKRGVLYEYPW